MQQKAESMQVEIAGAEIVGLVPEAAFDLAAAYVPFLENFSEDLILENCLNKRINEAG